MATGALTEVTEEIATNLEEVADATRKLNNAGVKFFFGGLTLGLLSGFYVGYRFNREKIRAEAFAESQKEVEKIRQAYAATRAATVPEKPDLEEVIEEKGYVAEEVVPPVKPKRQRGPKQRPLKPVVPVRDIPTLPEEWDYAKEVEKRTDTEPYILHQDEFKNSETGFNQVVYTYFAGDDVLVGEDERPLPHADIIVGEHNLKFGYGADDPDVVFVRNDHLELEMEICRTPKSYEEEVLGLENDNPT